MPEITVHFQGKKHILVVPNGELLLNSLRTNGYEIFSPCGGNGTCGKCKVYIKGEGYITSCLYPVEQDMEIVLPEKSEARILAAQYKYSRILALSPGKSMDLSSYPFGLAVDIGTTTLVFYLIQLITGSLIETRTEMNPQAKYGADVISRINYCILNPDGLKILQKEILQSVNDQLNHFTEKFGITPDDIVKITFSGNTTMLHLLLGVNPESLAFVPFTPVFTEQRIVKASSLNLKCNPDGPVKLLPSLSAYIGADIVAGIASLAPVKEHKNYLFIDVGTNGEMALVTPGTILCCAAAAGPAFEGANIHHGMGAMDGAICAFSMDGTFQTIGDAIPVGICGSGLIDLIAYVLEKEIVDYSGNMEENYIVVPEEASGLSEEIILSPKDIREVQLAKSAIAAGIKILLKQSGLCLEEIDALYLAGGFGNYIRTESAVSIGLIPHELSEKVIPVGNTSGTASVLSVKSESFDDVISETLSRMKFIELNEDEDFIMEFAMNMDFPIKGSWDPRDV